MKKRFSLARVALILTAACFLFDVVGGAAEAYTGKVAAVPEGDVLSVTCNGETKTVRVAGVDCPEMAQAYGPEAQKFTSGLVLGKEVIINENEADEKEDGADDAKWVIANVTFGDDKDLSHEIIAAGMGWTYEQHKPFDKALRGLSAKAIVAKKGLWSDPAPLAPWDFRADALKKKKAGVGKAVSLEAATAGAAAGQGAFITKNGAEYHKAGCVKLDKSMKVISVAEAERLKYSPCPLCFPPKFDEESIELQAKGPYENTPTTVFDKPKVQEIREDKTATEIAKIKEDPLYKEINPAWHKDANGNVDGISADNVFANPTYGPIAAGFGFQSGDVLHSVNGTKINSEQGIANLIQQNKNTRNFQVEIIRNGQPQTINIAIPPFL